MQTACEVIDSLLRSRPAQRVGLYDSPWDDALRRWVAQGYPTDSEGKPVSPTEHFGFDLVSGGGWFNWKARPEEEDTVVEQTEEWKVVKDGNGAFLKWWKNKSGTPEHLEFSMSSRDAWEREYKPQVVGSARRRITEKIIAETRDSLARWRALGRWVHYGHQFVWENMRGSLGDLTLYESMITDPEWIHDYCRTYTDLYKECFRILIEEAGKPDGAWIFEDLGYKGSLFASPKALSELIFPYFAELVEFFHGYDLPVLFHSCGFTEPALELIVAAGFDGLNPMEVKAGNDPLRIASRYADRLVFVGGLDARVLESKDRSLIRREVARLMEGMKERGARFVFASDHSLSTNIDYPDYLYALEVYREHMLY
jgi:hypothetical protein